MEKKRPIIIQGAMKSEIEYLKNSLEDCEMIELSGYKFYKGEYLGYPIIISKTEIGVIPAAIATFLGIEHFKPLAIINQGTAGGCGENIHKGDIVVGQKCININSYITPNKSRNEGSSSLEWQLVTFKEGVKKDTLIELEGSKILLDVAVSKFNKLKIGTIGSGDVWDKEIDRINWLNKNYNVLCEDMETISAYTVCKELNIDVIGLRVISNNEILNEEFDGESAEKSQKYSLEICEEIITRIKENKWK